MANIIFSPASEAQSQFLTEDADFVFYGGAAGAGKSHCLLGSFLKYCHHPRTRGVIFRRTTKQLSSSGGLFDAAIQLFSQVDPKLKIKMRDLKLVFSSGAELSFAYLDNDADRYNWQGTELTYIGFDEIQQLSMVNCQYLFTRLRSTTVDYKKTIYATGNPDPDCWLLDFVRPYLDERGIPFRKKHYPKRYFVNQSGEFIFSDDRKKLEEIYGSGADSGIMSFVFIPGTILDNPVLMEKDPSYVTRLKSAPRVEMERLLLGSWYARESASKYFSEEWTKVLPDLPEGIRKRVRSWDLAFTKPSERYKNPDWTAGVLMAKTVKGRYLVEDVKRERDGSHIIEELIYETARTDPEGTVVSLPSDAGGASAYVKGIQKRLAEMGITSKLVRPVKAKIVRFAPFSAVAEAGFVDVLIGEWNSSYFRELEAFTGERTNKDDQVDATSDAFYMLNRGASLPDFTLPDMSASTQYNFSYN